MDLKSLKTISSNVVPWSVSLSLLLSPNSSSRSVFSPLANDTTPQPSNSADQRLGMMSYLPFPLPNPSGLLYHQVLLILLPTYLGSIHIFLFTLPPL